MSKVSTVGGRRRGSMKPKELVDEEPKYPNRDTLYDPDTLIGEKLDTSDFETYTSWATTIPTTSWPRCSTTTGTICRCD